MVRGNGRDTPRRAGVEPRTGKGRTHAPGSLLTVFLRESKDRGFRDCICTDRGNGWKSQRLAHLYGRVHSSPTLHWSHMLTSPVF